MHQNAIIAIAATLGIMAGAGGTYIATSEPKVEAQAISKAELVAAISADPSLCPIPTVEAPTEAEALAAYRKAHAASPLVWHRKICRKSLWHSANVTRPGQGQVSLA